MSNRWLARVEEARASLALLASDPSHRWRRLAAASVAGVLVASVAMVPLVGASPRPVAAPTDRAHISGPRRPVATAPPPAPPAPVSPAAPRPAPADRGSTQLPAPGPPPPPAPLALPAPRPACQVGALPAVTGATDAMAVSPSGSGYWQVAPDGGVFTYGDAPFAGSMGTRGLASPVVGIAATRDGRGYWLASSDGGVFTFGDARYLGGAVGRCPADPVVGIAATPDGRGYWLASSDGGVFTYGDARYYGSMSGHRITAPVVGIAATPDGRGYWLASSDGGVFTYGDARYHGAMGGAELTAPVIALAPSRSGGGYWELGADGSMFSFGDAAYLGSRGEPSFGGGGPTPPLVSIFYYPWYATPQRDHQWRHWDEGGHAPPGDIGSDYYPVRRAYSSSDPNVVASQMSEIASADIQQVITSWWGRGSFEDSVLPTVARAARQAHLSLAVHIEPYSGRSPQSVAADLAYLRASFGVTDFYVYRAADSAAQSWAAALAGHPGDRLFATGDPDAIHRGSFAAWAAAAGFNGIYTYSAMSFAGPDFAQVCSTAHSLGLLCAPSVGPGFTAQRATGNRATRGRDQGATYDAAWRGALQARPDVVTITSYNEWHEGTQIEPAADFCEPGHCYENYEGAWGSSGRAASQAYLSRTRYWVTRSRR